MMQSIFRVQYRSISRQGRKIHGHFFERFILGFGKVRPQKPGTREAYYCQDEEKSGPRQPLRQTQKGGGHEGGHDTVGT